MRFFVNPFKRNDVRHFPGVLVPLRDAPRHPSVLRAYDEKLGAAGEAVDVEAGKQPRSPADENEDAPNTIEGLRRAVDSELAASGHEPIYDRKSKLINMAIQDIGMGRYNWELFVLCGFGWFADNFWFQGLALTLGPIAKEFGISSTKVRYTTMAAFIGLCIGASFWGIASDIIGRRVAFNATLFLAGVFGLAAAASPNWVTACALYACMGVGVGGNLPVDGALFLEFLPFHSGSLLTMLSLWWPVGQLLASLLAWAFIPNYPNDKGWRYLIYTMGGITLLMFFCRFALFHLYESPKFLLSRGRQAQAVATVHGLAARNRKQTWLTDEILNEVGGVSEGAAGPKLSTSEILRRQVGKFSAERVGPLFQTRQLAITTLLVWFCWLTLGMGYPLFNAFLIQYLAQPAHAQHQGETPDHIVYRNYAITSMVGIPGSLLAWYTVDLKYVGRKGTMAVSTLVSGIFIYLFTIASSANYQLACTCIEAFFQNAMYGVFTPEVFPAPNRGTGTGIASFLNRLAGLSAPIIAANVQAANPATPIYVAGALFLAAFVAMCFLPIETRGKQSL
ncbi:MAG: hypothetical protein M1826_007283 [Phylliscum demangeonii]|nr:MAG: hypothetical protein M1826_007283 [Phylliscum demangeonii]